MSPYFSPALWLSMTALHYEKDFQRSPFVSASAVSIKKKKIGLQDRECLLLNWILINGV